MNRAWCWSCLVFLCLGNYGRAQVEAQVDAEGIRPIAVLAFSGYGEFNRNLEYLGKLSGSPDTATSLEQWLSRITQGQALASVDPDRPWGGYLTITEDFQFWGVSFLPVSDIAKLVAAFSAIYGEPVDLDSDVYQFQGPKQNYFVAQKGNWAYWTQQKSALDALPRDPLSLISGLDRQYDLAVRVNVRNIPQTLRDTATVFIKQWLEAKLLRTPDEDDEQPNTLDADIVRRKVEQLSGSINEFDQVTVGLKIDRAKNRTDLEVVTTALPDSAAAKTFAAGAV